MLKISVRDLVCFVYQSGSITSTNMLERAEQGRNIHLLRQEEYDQNQIAEYYINGNYNINDEEIELNGYIDGILNLDNLEIEEIKSTTKDFDDNFIYLNEHLAQLKVYAYMLLKNMNKTIIKANLLYINIKNNLRYNYEYYFNIDELEAFLYTTILKYKYYQEAIIRSYIEAKSSLKDLSFPYSNIREGQQTMMAAVKETLEAKDNIMIEAPTGIGKTIASMFSAIKCLKNKDDKVFYLTAKNSGALAAIKAALKLNIAGFLGRVVEIKAKSKMCLKGENHPNCDNCKYGFNYYAKINDIVRDIITNNYVIDSNLIKLYAKNYGVCPFELSLDLSNYCQVIICDYNYVFDPRVRLKRFFVENIIKPYILIDEAHNFLNRSEEMYSACFSMNNIYNLYRYFNKYNTIKKLINDTINYLNKKYGSLLLENNNFYYEKQKDNLLINLLININDLIKEHLDDEEIIKYKDLFLDDFLELNTFVVISELYNENHLSFYRLIDNKIEITLKCINAVSYLSNIIKNETKGVVFFSATLKPFKYFNDYFYEKDLNYLELESPFNKENLLKIIRPISTKYRDRYYTISQIINDINVIINIKKGKYIVYVPSYEYQELLINNLMIDNYEIYYQKRGEQNINNQAVLEVFSKKENILGIFVLGGIFSEGLDFKRDLLDGVIILGVGLPQISQELNIIKDNINLIYNNKGYDYIYTYPGMTKVVQAIGRVIRTEEDKGIIVLFDDRYQTKKYLNLFPTHLADLKIIKNEKELIRTIINFKEEKGL